MSDINERIGFLYSAQNRLGLAFGVGLYADSYNSDSNLNTSSSSGYIVDVANHRIANQLSGPANPTATFSNGDLSGFPRSNAYDNNLSTFWASIDNEGLNDYLGFDFGSAIAPDHLVLQQRQDGNGCAATVNVEFSNDQTTWTTLLSNVACSTAVNNSTTIQCTGATAHRYWRVKNTSLPTGGSYAWALAEVHWFTLAATAITLISASANAASSGVTNPARGRLLVEIDAASDALTLNTDLVASISRDGGTTFTAGVLSKQCNDSAGNILIETNDVDLGAQPARSNLCYRLVGVSTKKIYLRGVALSIPCFC